MYQIRFSQTRRIFTQVHKAEMGTEGDCCRWDPRRCCRERGHPRGNIGSRRGCGSGIIATVTGAPGNAGICQYYQDKNQNRIPEFHSSVLGILHGNKDTCHDNRLLFPRGDRQVQPGFHCLPGVQRMQEDCSRALIPGNLKNLGIVRKISQTVSSKVDRGHPGASFKAVSRGSPSSFGRTRR